MTIVSPVLIVALSKRYGGADVRVLQLARAFEQVGQPYHVATLDGSDLHKRLEGDGLQHHSVPYGRGNPQAALFLRRLVKQHGYGIIDAHNPQSQFWGHLATLGQNVKRIATIHSAYRFEHDHSLRGYAYERVLTLNDAQGVDFIAVSDAVQSYLTDVVKIDAERVTMIPNGIAVLDEPVARQEHALYAEWGWTDNHPVIIAVGRLEAVKGHTDLIEAMHLLHPAYPQLRCVIVGEGRMRDDLTTLIDQHALQDIVRLVGFRTDVTELLAASDIFAMPSRSEGLPFALLEAASLALPLIASNVGGMAVLLDHKKTAYLIPPDNPQQLAEGIKWMLDNPSEAALLAESAHALVAAEYSLSAMVEHTLAVYR